MDQNLILHQNSSFMRENWAESLFTFRWSYKDVGFQHYKECNFTIKLVENDQTDRIYFHSILN